MHCIRIALFTLSLTCLPLASLAVVPDAEQAVESIATLIERAYYDADRAARIAAMLRDASASGHFDRAESPDAIASLLSEMLIKEDRHFSVNYIGPEEVQARLHSAKASLSVESTEGNDDILARMNFGFSEVKILPGNIGYLRLDRFVSGHGAYSAATAALRFIANSDAVIIDLRTNGGGDRQMVQFLISHFLDPNNPVIINTFVSRRHENPQQMWQLIEHPAGFRPEIPLFVLTSGSTGSAAEGFAYHLRAMERATLVGETTYGAGNPGGTLLTDEGYVLFVSTGSARNPITGTNWEGVGVTPHIEIESDQALDRARLEAFNSLLAESDLAEDQRAFLRWGQERLNAELEPVAVPSEQAARLVGDYGIRDITFESGQLYYQREGSDPRVLVPLGGDRFMFADDDKYRFAFEFDDDGQPTVLLMIVNDGRVIRNARQ